MSRRDVSLRTASRKVAAAAFVATFSAAAMAGLVPFSLGPSSPTVGLPYDEACVVSDSSVNDGKGFSALACHNSPVILKINNDGTTDTNTILFPDLSTGVALGTGTNLDPWEFNGFSVWLSNPIHDGYNSGAAVNQIDWSYDSTGPAVTYFIVKYGNQPRYYGTGEPITSAFASAFGQGAGVSHIEFYDSGVPLLQVPEPGILALLGLGAVGMCAFRKRMIGASGARRRGFSAAS